MLAKANDEVPVGAGCEYGRDRLAGQTPRFPERNLLCEEFVEFESLPVRVGSVAKRVCGRAGGRIVEVFERLAKMR